MKKSRYISHSSDSSTFTGLSSYRLSVFSIPHFSKSFQWFLWPHFHVWFICTYSVQTWDILILHVLQFSFLPHNEHIGYTFSPNTLFRILLVFKAWSWADMIIFLVSFFQILFLQPAACCISSDLILYSLESPMGNFAFITTFMLLINTFFFLSSFTWCFVLQNFSSKNSSSVDIK